MAAPVTYFGIRHHGPGSAAALLAGLDELRPAHVLIEGPADASELLVDLASVHMRPPVALLSFPVDDPSMTSFWPFAQFSPEYQATCWAVQHGVPVAFIDLPSTARFEDRAKEAIPEVDDEGIGDVEVPLDRHRIDPIAVLAESAGYEDGESWWADLVEENRDPGPIFDAISTAMSEVRASEPDTLDDYEARREAHMRLAIAACAKTSEGPVAVVCGAWHVPALKAKHTQANDKATLGTLPRKKAQMTWAPWTMPRLALGVGYGAGVVAPGWCQHLWDTRDRNDGSSVWLAQIAHVMRDKGHLISTASLIEAQRLAIGLAAMRDRPQPGFEELKWACIACLFAGDELLWTLIEDELLLGKSVGQVPPGVQLAPLIEDLQIQSRKAKLKIEALDRELSVDLRSESGLFRSTLLHRLNLLGVPWGTLTSAGRSRGTFRENWILSFEPEYNVELVTKLVYGPSIEQAASGLLMENFAACATLTALASGVSEAITAALPHAVAHGLELLEKRAALSSDCQDILSTLPAMANVVRYGQARATDLSSLAGLAEQLIVEASINLVYAARGLDEDNAHTFGGHIEKADEGIRLIQPAPDVMESWTRGLRSVLDDSQATAYVAGCVASLLYEAEDLPAQEAVDMLAIRLSPGTPVVDAAGYFEGFFSHTAMRLIFDDGLRTAVDQWLMGLSSKDYIACLPLMRRVLSELDSMERKRLLGAVFGQRQSMPSGLVLAPDDGLGWLRHFDVVSSILIGGES